MFWGLVNRRRAGRVALGVVPAASLAPPPPPPPSFRHDEAKGVPSRQRAHLLPQPPWSADAFIQQAGRSHRSGQVTAPAYTLLTTDAYAETRFVSTISSRLAALGAITRGDRRAASPISL